MERLLRVEFGPSRSKRFLKALAEARSGAGECSELEPGSYRARFILGTEQSAYTSLARLLQRVRNWRATEVYEGEALVSTHLAGEMAWCASFQLAAFQDCRFHFYLGVYPRCALCPLFDAERASRELSGQKPPPGMAFDITLGPNLRALLPQQPPSTRTPRLDPDWHVPDFPPEEWPKQAAQEPPG
jgi:hypothetical protein